MTALIITAIIALFVIFVIIIIARPKTETGTIISDYRVQVDDKFYDYHFYTTSAEQRLPVGTIVKGKVIIVHRVEDYPPKYYFRVDEIVTTVD